MESRPNLRPRANTAVLYSFHDYVLFSRLAHGPGTELFAARRRAGGDRGELFTVKRISPQLSAGKGVVDRFMQAVRIGNSIPHPQRCRIHEAGVAENSLFVATDLFAGMGLDRISAWLQRRGSRMPVDLMVRVMSEVATALEVAHACNLEGGRALIHANLTLSNILVGYDGGIKLSDFGLRAALSSPPGNARLQRGALEAQAHDDVLGLAKCVLTLLGEHDPRSALNSERSGSNALRSIALRVLERAPGARPPNASAFRQALQQLEVTRAANRSTSSLGKWMRVEFSAAMRASEELQVHMLASNLAPLPDALAPEQSGPRQRAPLSLARQPEATLSAIRRAVLTRPAGRRWLLACGAAGVAVLGLGLALERESTLELGVEAAVPQHDDSPSPIRAPLATAVVSAPIETAAPSAAPSIGAEASQTANWIAPGRSAPPRKLRRRSAARDVAAPDSASLAPSEAGRAAAQDADDSALAPTALAALAPPAPSIPTPALGSASSPEPAGDRPISAVEASTSTGRGAPDGASPAQISERPGGDLKESTPLLQESPRFPARARRRGVRNGNVQVAFTIDRSGAVRDAAVVSAIPPDIFDEAALEAVTRWRYSPRTKAGVPVDRRNVQVRLLFSEGR